MSLYYLFEYQNGGRCWIVGNCVLVCDVCEYDGNMWTNILLKRCVLTNVAQHNHIPCFGYAFVLAINRLFTDLTGVQYLAENENGMINEVSACFKTSGVRY